jgi:hypothetical protein
VPLSRAGTDFRKAFAERPPRKTIERWDDIYDAKMKGFMVKVALARMTKGTPLGKWSCLLPDDIILVCTRFVEL